MECSLFTRQLRNNDAGDVFAIVRGKCTNFLNVILEDSGVEKTDLSHAALHVLGVCLHESQFTRYLIFLSLFLFGVYY